MELRKTRKYHVNLGNYEWAEFSAEVTVESEHADVAIDLANIALDQALRDDIEDAHHKTAEDDSFIHLSYEDIKRNAT